MKTAVTENGKFTIKEVATPLLEEYENGAIVKVEGCGLCGSDIIKLLQNKVPNGSVLGHEVVGEIIEIKTNTPFLTGDRIVLGHHIPCFYCEYCHGESYSMCKHFKSTNIIPGGFSEYIYVSEEHLNNTVFYANLSLSAVEASFMEPLACCLRAIKRAQIADNSKILVIGLGSIGILMGQAAKVYGHRVYGCDLLQERVNFSEKYGFNKSILYEEQTQTLKKLKEITKSGFDVIFLTAGASSTIEFAIQAARDGAKIVVFSSVKNNTGFFNNDIYYRELTIMGSYSASPVDLEDSIRLLEERKVKVEGISTEYKLQDINLALNDTITNKIMKAYIKI